MSQSRETEGSDSWKPYIFLVEKTSEFLWRSLKSILGLLLIASFLFVFYLAFSNQPQWKRPECPSVVQKSMDRTPSPANSPPNFNNGTNISHILFGIGGSVSTWPKRRRYSELWWKHGQTRGFVWLDKEPENGDQWPATSIPYRVSEDSSRFRYECPYGSRSAVRIARIVAESVRLGMENVRWYVMGDDDTVFFTENLVEVLGKYNHEEYRYIGSVSESVEQDVVHSYGMAYGGGGFAISYGLARELARVLDGCLDRYTTFYGSDQRVHACLTEIGVPLTKEPGFHQVDIRGDAYGLLAAHPMAPVLSLHHLDQVKPLMPPLSQFDAVRKILIASSVDPGRTLQQTFCYDTRRNWSVSVSWGYTAQIYPWILTPKELATPLRTFQTWRTSRPEPFTFNTRSWSGDTCQIPLVYFLDRLYDVGGFATRTFYARHRDQRECGRFGPALKMKNVEVLSFKMAPGEWTKAPRRYCCNVQNNETEEGSIRLRIRKCRQGETLSPP